MNTLPQELMYPEKLHTSDEILDRPSPIPRQPGVYAWYIRNLPEIVPTADCHHHKNFPLVYIGISRNLRKRMRQHLKGPTNISTLRRALASLLVEKLDLMPQMISKRKFNLGKTEETLSQWLRQNAFVVWLAHPNPRQMELTFLNGQLSLPLNVEGNKNHPFRPTLIQLRKSLKTKATTVKATSTKKVFFPITRSTPSAEALAPLIEETYNLQEVRCHLIKGLMLHTYHVNSSDGRFVFRIYPHGRRTVAEIEEELAFLQHLERHDIPVSVPIPMQDGRLHFSLPAPEGAREAALFSYAAGQAFENRDSAENVYRFGRLLAQLHKAAETFSHSDHRSPFSFQTLVESPLTYLEKNLSDRNTDWEFLRTIAPQLEATLAGLPAEPPVRTYIHGDLGSNNIHMLSSGVDGADSSFTFFDFDLCGPGPRAFDLAVFLIDEPKETFEAFLAGYQSISALSSAEIRAIPQLQIMQNIWLLALRASYINEWGSAFLSGRFIDNVLENIKANLGINSPG